ncbi:MAG: protein kinase [Deltaproteobacteria bacterium]|nr:protein kinase [Deltaproteobacteria bacterium]
MDDHCPPAPPDPDTAPVAGPDIAALTTFWAETLGDALQDGTLDARDHLPKARPRASSGVVTVRDLDLLPVATVKRSQPGEVVASGHRHGASGVTAAGGSFEIREVLGQGGMGVVFRAHQGSLDRDIALKTLKAESAQQGGRERFVAEARVTGALDHPNIVPVHELGRSEDGEVFLAMKLVRGVPWSALLHPKSADECAAAQTWDRARHLDVLLQVCNAVSFAHSRGVVHRDLKPDNVMVGEYGEVLVMDWGIAIDVRVPAPDDLRAPHVSMVRGPAGTPCYMPPELATGDSDAMGPRTDVYLLGAVLHEILTGRPPHQGSSVLQVLVAAARAEPPEFDDEVPTCLQAICARALARDPADRHGSVAELRAALVEFQQHAQSMRLGDEALAVVAQLDVVGLVAPELRYSVYSEALARFDQALALWAGNDPARRQRATARLGLAREALAKNDVGLARSHLRMLQGDPAADPATVALLQLQFTRFEGSRRVRWIAAALLLLLVVGAAAFGAQVHQEGKQRTAARQRRDLVAVRLSAGWTALGQGDTAGAQRALDQVRDLQPGDVVHALERSQHLAYGIALALWRDGAFDALWQSTCGQWVAAVGGGTAERALGAPLGAWTGQSLCRRLADRLTRGSAAERSVWADRATAALRTWKQPTDAAVAGDLAAVYALAPQWLAHGELAAPFALARAPVPLQAAPLPAGATVRRDADGTWLAVGSDGALLWRRAWQGDIAQGGQSRAIAAGQGGVVLCEASAVLVVDGRTGTVLHRSVLDGRIAACAPDPRGHGLHAVVSSHQALGAVHVVRFDGVAPPQVAQGENLSDTLAISGRAMGLVDGDRAATARRLDAELALDPLDPYLWVARIEAAEPTDDRRVQWARAAVHASRALPPRNQVMIGTRLERAGQRSHADAAYTQATAAFVERGGNPDLNLNAIASPASPLRKLAAEHVKAGDVARAHHLIEVGRRFSTYVEGDHAFYRRYQKWRLAATQVHPATPSADELQRRLDESRHTAGVFVLPMWLPAVVDQSLFCVVWLTALLMLVVVGHWVFARDTQHAELRALGFATAGQRWLAFVTHPVERMRLVLVTYLGRPARLALAGLGLLVLLAVGIAAASTQALQQLMTLGPHLGAGFASEDGFLRDLDALPADRRDRPATLRLRAEGHAARGEGTLAGELLQRALQSDPDEPIARNNLGVLAERAGQRAKARTHYASAAAIDGGATAAWNLARLDRDAAGLATAEQRLPHRDRVAAEVARSAALWARASTRDLAETLVAPEGWGTTVAVAVGDSLRGDSLDVIRQVLLVADAQSAFGAAALIMGTIGVDLAALALLGGLLSLGAAVRPVREPPVCEVLPRWATRVRNRLWRLLLWLVPGLDAVGSDRPAQGMLVAALYVVLFGLSGTLYGEGAVAAATSAHSFDLFPGAPVDPAETGLNAWGMAARVAVTVLLLGHWWRMAKRRG